MSMNSGSDVSKSLGCLMHIGQEEEYAGKKAGERMKAEGVKKAFVINQEVGNVALDLRARGFSEGLGEPAEVLAVKMDLRNPGMPSPPIYRRIRTWRASWRSALSRPNPLFRHSLAQA